MTNQEIKILFHSISLSSHIKVSAITDMTKKALLILYGHGIWHGIYNEVNLSMTEKSVPKIEWFDFENLTKIFGNDHHYKGSHAPDWHWYSYLSNKHYSTVRTQKWMVLGISLS